MAVQRGEIYFVNLIGSDFDDFLKQDGLLAE